VVSDFPVGQSDLAASNTVILRHNCHSGERSIRPEYPSPLCVEHRRPQSSHTQAGLLWLSGRPTDRTVEPRSNNPKGRVPHCQRWQVGRLGAENEAIPPRPNVQESFKTAFTCSAKRSNANGIHVPSTCGKTANAARESAWTWRLGETGIDRGNRMSVQTVHQPMFFSSKNRVI
jgi:hypothetical protein